MVVATLFAGTAPQLSAFTNQAAEPADDHSTAARATASPQGVLVEWTSSLANQILGFNLFRFAGGKRVKLNPSLIAGPTLIFSRRAERFAWFDPAGASDSIYEIESIDLRGESLLRTSAANRTAAILPAYQQAPLLADVGRDKGTQISNAEWIDASKTHGSAELVAADTSATLAQQWFLASQPALKIGIRGDGWYRITQPQLAAAGFDVTRDARNLQLFVEGNEIAMSVSRDSGVLSPADVIEFWGQGLDSPTTDTRVYWLVNGQQRGKRITISGDLRPNITPNGRVVTAADPIPAVASSPTQFALAGSWPIPETASGRATVAQSPEIVAVVKATGCEALSDDADRIESKTRKKSSAEIVPDQPLAKELTPRPVPSAESNATVPPTVAAANRALVFNPMKSRARPGRKRSRKQRRRPRLRWHNHALDILAAAPAFTYSTESSARSIYYTAALNGDHENFFGPIVSGSGANITLTTRHIERTSTAPVQLTVSLQGVTLGTHQINILVNGAPAGLITFTDQSATVQTLAFPGAWLIDGDNVIKIAPTSSTNDLSLVDFVRATYPHSFSAENDSLQFSLRATQSARVDGFTTADIRVVDVTDPAAVQSIRPIIEAAGPAFAATVPATEHGKARRLIALPANRISTPVWLTLNQPSVLNSNGNAADLLIIAYKDFIPSLAPLVAQRQAQGYAVKIADIDDVYDEFSFGEHTPQAVRDFMTLARNTWTRAPSYLLLVGDASYDPRDRLAVGNFDLVPTKLIDTGTAGTATALETASDDWLIDFDGNGIADLAVGRLPVRTVAEANLIVSKIVNYSPANSGNKALLVADTQGSYYFNFEAANDQVATILPAGMTVQKVYRRLQPSDANARTNIIASLNSGQSVTVYSGHGNVDIWGGSIFTGTDAAGLTNGNKLSFVVVMDCLNGFFADPSLKSLAEAFLSAPNGGAVASFASSGLTIPDGQHEMGFRMLQLLYNGSPMAVGDASRQAKLATTDVDVRRTWILFGDPTLKIR